MKRYDMCHAKMVECYDGDYVLFDESKRLAMCEANSNAVLADVRAMAQDIIFWQKSFNELSEELEKITETSRLKVIVKTVDETIMGFMPKGD